MLEENRMNISDIKFDFNCDTVTINYTNATRNHTIQSGVGKYVTGEFPEKHYFGRKIGVAKGSGYRYKASGAWFNDDTFMIYLYIIDDYFGTLKINVNFRDDKITLAMSKVAEWFLDEYSGIAVGIAQV
jgi:hypothetical protein